MKLDSFYLRANLSSIEKNLLLEGSIFVLKKQFWIIFTADALGGKSGFSFMHNKHRIKGTLVRNASIKSKLEILFYSFF